MIKENKMHHKKEIIADRLKKYHESKESAIYIFIQTIQLYIKNEDYDGLKSYIDSKTANRKMLASSQ